MPDQQPDDMTCGKAAILTIGINVNGEACQYVFPIVTNATALTPANLCLDAVESFEDSLISDVQATLSSDNHVTFIQATGMIPGRIPFRKPYAPTVYPGTAAAGSVTSQVSALGIIYQDPEDETVPGGRIRQAKTFVTGMPHTFILGNQITGAFQTILQGFMEDLQSGWPSFIETSSNWYRILDKPPGAVTDTPVKRLLQAEVRGGIYTQKRRLTPRQS